MTLFDKVTLGICIGAGMVATHGIAYAIGNTVGYRDGVTDTVTEQLNILKKVSETIDTVRATSEGNIGQDGDVYRRMEGF